MDHIHQYYNEIYKEEDRLTKTKQSQIEFYTNKHFIEKYLKEGMHILDVGAGTGQYSLYYANLGYQVSSVELVQKNIEILNSKITDKMNIDVKQGDARDLSMYEDEMFDFVLCFGPLYHLGSDEDKKQCMKECLRVLKPGGIIAFAYINRYLVFVNEAHRYPEVTLTPQMMNQLFVSKETKLFYFLTPHDFEMLINDFKINKQHHLTSDGISELIAESINQMTDEQYQIWLDYHMMTCEDASILGYGMHNLYIGQK